MTIAAVPAELPILRVTALDVPTERALMAACDAMAAGRRLCRRDVNLAVTDCSLDAGALAGAAGAMELALSPFHPRFDVTFVTPTSFSQGGDRHLPLPVPDLIMRSWARRWNAFAPPDAPPIPPATLDAVAANVVVSRADIRTCTLDVGRGKVVAFVGDVALAAVGHRSWQPDERRAFAVLCAYSRFCGTGARTIQGFGLTLPSTSEPVGE
jgi:CRISPR/Cas system endoribonuclease Cas6 (RAMP superfamily)